MKIYVGNMPYAMTEDELRNVFEAYGTVASASLAMDRETRRPRGFGFVEMPEAAEANAAISALNGTEQGGRKLVINEARPKEDRPRGPRTFSGNVSAADSETEHSATDPAHQRFQKHRPGGNGAFFHFFPEIS